MKNILRSIGPALIVASLVLGPGSILTSSKVGATFGLVGIPVIIVSAILMIAMVALAARIGVVYEGSFCDELSARAGKVVTISIATILFVLIALFQSSNNIAMVGGLESLVGEEAFAPGLRAALLVGFNLGVIAILYLLRNLYRHVETAMKCLIGLITLAFVINIVFAFLIPRDFVPVAPEGTLDWLPLLGMIGTTFSVGGAVYQAYLVKEKGWGIGNLKQSTADSVLSISMLGVLTCVILLTAWRAFYGNPNGVALGSVGDVARQLEPLLGSTARVVFSLGILAGALSSFLVNAMIGGTVFSDAIGRGSRLDQRGPLHLTAAALLVGMAVAIASLMKEGSTVHLITIAQALTVLGIPAIAASLIYLGTRPELTGERKIPPIFILLAKVGFIVSCGLAALTAIKVADKIWS